MIMQNLNEIQIDLSVPPDVAKAELIEFYRILTDKYHCRSYDVQSQNHLFSEKKEEDVLIGLFDGASDLSGRSEEILQEETARHSGWTWKKQ